MNNSNVKIDVDLVRRLVGTQFPQWKNLPIKAIANGGWDNRTFHLGDQLLVRMPSAEEYASSVEKEFKWLPRLAPLLPLTIPEPLAIGQPGEGYPWKWSINLWIKGETAKSAKILDKDDFAASLANFLIALQSIDPSEGPLPGAHSFYRGGELATYDSETRQAIAVLKDKIDVDAALTIWELALKSTWEKPPVWVHGDISAGNLLVHEGKLCAVIDFGQLTIGDPACDLVMAWTFFDGESRNIFQKTLQLDAGTWARTRAWALWKALIVAVGSTDPGNFESMNCWRTMEQLLQTH